jgi:hypothetical protein
VKKLAKFRYALLGLAILACSAAWYFLIRVPYTKNEPKESDLVGIYRPDFKKHALFFMRSNFPPTNSEIKVESGGKIELVSLLHWLIQDDTNTFEEASISTNGAWHLEKSGDGWMIMSEYGQHNGSMSIYLQLIGEKNLIVSDFVLGTPALFSILCRVQINIGFLFMRALSFRTVRAYSNTNAAWPCGQ